jgi:uncharacterized oligopeptide transporter (OPT) family protein
MALVVDGILTQKLPWGLILIGAFLAIAIELVGIPSLPVAVGVYLPISTSAAMFMGGVIRWLVDRRQSREERESADADSGPGVLFSSGLIAGGAIMGVALAGLAARHLDDAFNMTKAVGSIGTSNLVSIVCYVLFLAVPLYLVARRVQRTIG